MATATTTSPQLNASGTRAVNPALPPIAAETPSRMPPMRRISSSARERLSVYSTASQTSHRSRPVSHVFPLFHSSLTYALVRDFAYASTHPLHYGPLPVPSRASTPASETRRLSDPQIGLWESSRHSWSSNSATSDFHGQQLPAVSFAADGPPYSEDEDLHSPIITSRYRKHKSMFTFGDTGSGFGNSGHQGDVPNNSVNRGSLVAVNEDGSKTYYVPGDQEANDGPGGEYITYPNGQGQQSQMGYGNYDDGSGVGGHEGGYGASSVDHGGDYYTYEEEYSDRYSRDYHFSIGSPDEEMHGKAVALFDFTREHENELPLQEGQVILVSYRHGQGWLVAEDPKTGESGLVPEEFVRLVRDIEGGLSSLNGEISSIANDPQYQPDTTSTTATSIQTSEDTSDAAAAEQGESEQPERKNTRGEESDEQTERK